VFFEKIFQKVASGKKNTFLAKKLIGCLSTILDIGHYSLTFNLNLLECQVIIIELCNLSVHLS